MNNPLHMLLSTVNFLCLLKLLIILNQCLFLCTLILLVMEGLQLKQPLICKMLIFVAHAHATILVTMCKLPIPSKVKFFSWFLLGERLKTRHRLHVFSPSIPFVCVLCNQHDETLDHLFIHCPSFF